MTQQSRTVAVGIGLLLFCFCADLYCSAAEEGPSAKINFLNNGSFELGLLNDWASPYFDKTPMAVTDDTTATHGKRSLILTAPQLGWAAQWRMTYRPVTVLPGKTYTFAADFKAEGKGMAVNGKAINEEWQRIAFQYKPATNYLEVVLDFRGRGAIRMDSAMLVEGTDASVFVPADPVEMGIYCEPPGNIFKEKENVVIKVSAVSYEADTVVKPQISLVDCYNEKRWEKSVVFKLKAGIVQEKAVKISLNRFGSFRAELR
ncbi:MAG: hypothetical protein JXN60_00070, partial [Lentisphaerae bacterium]|nr:hypothetical protein [Lentisphaerota bacterium]